ncbi:vWA domain-containing protein [Marinisporobacter balticus]|uniref:Ca-activated chloride channel family protein n=1 Tax=Marinisporobacter balticus TaxID=2018667 RepID=A0A4R2KL18_9FIRM|nr:VWA domain-containing protein [Marinisporobacter balticus]TCO71356.1 Ca-activated chloride channel family protein [Marinisporobacter balticus]
MVKVEIRQIIVVTDGKSNVGGNPVTAAAEAYRENVIVNAIGIMDDRGSDDDSLCEVEKIAQMGGGIWENTIIQNLGQTMHVVTQKTVNKTIETIVGKQLKAIMGKDLEDMPPKVRSKVIDYMEQLGEEVNIKCCILMDCSGSMKNKMSTARQSIIELMHSLKGRKGKNQVAVISYPGQNGEFTALISDFTENIGALKDKVFGLKAGGTTPTAAAINSAVTLIKGINHEELEDVVRNSEPLLKESMV